MIFHAGLTMLSSLKSAYDDAHRCMEHMFCDFTSSSNVNHFYQSTLGKLRREMILPQAVLASPAGTNNTLKHESINSKPFIQ